MNYLILLFTILLGHFSNAQSSSTFFIKNKASDDIKKVYYVGDKITLLLNNSTNSNLKVKGVINDISIDKIKVDDKWIEVSNIQRIKSHSSTKKMIGSLGMAIGGVVMLIQNPFQIDYLVDIISKEQIGVVLFFSSTAVLLIPKKYRNLKYNFKTYLAP